MTLKEWTQISAVALLFTVVLTWTVAFLATNRNSGPVLAVLWILTSISTSVLVLVED